MKSPLLLLCLVLLQQLQYYAVVAFSPSTEVFARRQAFGIPRFVEYFDDHDYYLDADDKDIRSSNRGRGRGRAALYYGGANNENREQRRFGRSVNQWSSSYKHRYGRPQQQQHMMERPRYYKRDMYEDEDEDDYDDEYEFEMMERRQPRRRRWNEMRPPRPQWREEPRFMDRRRMMMEEAPMAPPPPYAQALYDPNPSDEAVETLFYAWNDALATLDPDVVARRYARSAVLLPTVSDEPRTNYDRIRAYFVDFLKKAPQGTILESHVTQGPGWCMDAGIYEFVMRATGETVQARYTFLYTFEDGEWKISHHHSSGMPEKSGDKKKKSSKHKRRRGYPSQTQNFGAPHYAIF